MRYRYVVADVFTPRQRFGGNPLAVVTGRARHRRRARCRHIAREFNLSETVFVLPPDKRGAFSAGCASSPPRGRAALRRATRRWARHCVLAALGASCRSLATGTARIVVEEGVGPIAMEVRAAARRRAPGPAFTLEQTEPDAETASVGAAGRARRRHAVAGCRPASGRRPWLLLYRPPAGMRFLFIELGEAPRRFRTRAAAARTIWDKPLIAAPGPAISSSFHPHARSAGGGHPIKKRGVRPRSSGIFEDPATGAACAGLRRMPRPAQRQGGRRLLPRWRRRTGRRDGTPQPDRGRGREARRPRSRPSASAVTPSSSPKARSRYRRPLETAGCAIRPYLSAELLRLPVGMHFSKAAPAQ